MRPDRGAARRVVVLGATGSIGLQALEVSERLGLEVVAVGARTPGEALAAVAARFPAARVVASGGSGAERREFADRVGARADFGSEALVDLAATHDTVVVNGIVGAAGLRASVAALEAGNRLALANKESLVAGGAVVTAALHRGRGELIPIDSEHSALYQLLDGVPRDQVSRLLVTASGGPFRGRSREELADVTAEEALRHPTWEMGSRITIDSATLANKGLEVIEANALFGVSFDDISVVVHPQSIVHSLIRLRDGALLAHLGATDMRIPIQYALTHPQRSDPPGVDFDLLAQALTFESPDPATFRALGLAYQAGRAGGTAPAVFNAADEVAVEAFLAGRLGFLGIAEVIERTLAAVAGGTPGTVEDVLAADAEARATAAGLIGGAC